MAESSIGRTLWYEDRDKRETIPQEDLRSETAPLIVLGEAGSGKSHLLEWLGAAPGYAKCTARQLLNRHDPKTLIGDATTLVIDALDEVSAQREGDAVDLVLRQLGALGYPNFVISCRVADWRHATGVEAIREQYDSEPLELHLQPFNEEDQIAFLAATMGDTDAHRVVDHFNSRGLEGLLGNPQTLELIADIGADHLPDTRGELFTRAIEVMWAEHRDAKAERQPARKAALDAAGAAFAVLILTGSEAIVRSAGANLSEGELALADIRALPGGDAIDAMLDTRLFKADGTKRFHYWHRRIGEYLGARWLAKQADTDRKRRRLLAMFHAYGLVPASLRGLHAWLARDPALANEVIAADPMGVIEYGDADNLTTAEARALIQSLERLALDNPRFRDWGPYSLRGIAQPDLLPDIRRLIATPGIPYGLRLLTLQAIKGSPIAAGLATELQELVVDTGAVFASRSAAGEALAGLGGPDWPIIMSTLREAGDELSIRLAIELLDDVGYETFSDELIVDLAVRHLADDGRTIGVLFRTEKLLPDDRLDGMLNCLRDKASSLGRPHHRPGDHGLTDFAYALIVRRVSLGNLDPELFWSWIEPYDGSVGYRRETRQQLDVLLRRETALRRAIQRHVILDLPGDKNPWQRSWRLAKRASGLQPDIQDTVALLKALDPANRQDLRWRDVLALVRHDGEEGAEARQAARPFAEGRNDLLAWLDGLAVPRPPEWQLKQEEQERKRRGKQAMERADHQKHFAEHIPAMRAGDYGVILNPAKAYLNLFRDIGEGVPAHERVAQWLGPEIAEAAHTGFEAFLTKPDPKPDADEIAESFAEGRQWEASFIIVAALAERFRGGTGFDDLPNERLMAGLYELRHAKIDDHAGIVGLDEAIATSLRERGVWDEALRRYYDPQFEHRCAHVSSLYSLMRDDLDIELANAFAIDWLNKYPDMPLEPEGELIDRLLRSKLGAELQILVRSRVDVADTERRLVWDAIGLVVDFEATVARLMSGEIDPALIWRVRRHSNGRFDEAPSIDLAPHQLEWIINTFRPLWPAVDRPSGATSGDGNTWDASDYLSTLIRRLGNDASIEAIASLSGILDAPEDGYTDFLKSVRAEQTRKRVEAAYSAPALDAVKSVVSDQLPTSAADLQAMMLEELEIVQAKVRSDDAESWRGFFDAAGPLAEEPCRDHLLGLLRQGSHGVILTPEVHVAADREVDIACAAGGVRLPVEIKGQWHAELWRATDDQLDSFYSKDWQAEGRGIYLVLWFGEKVPSNKRLRRPAAGQPVPSSADELKTMVAQGSRAVRDGRIEIFVLDLTRP